MMDVHAQPDVSGGRVFDRAGREQEKQSRPEFGRSPVDDAADTLRISSDAALLSRAFEPAKETRIGERRTFEAEKSSESAVAENANKPKAEKKREGFNPLHLSGALVYRSPDVDSGGDAPRANAKQTVDASQTGYFESAGGKIVNVVRGRILNVVS
ncbi:MAG: hypothetical protein ABW189_07655 [Rickettsiales bacterium]